MLFRNAALFCGGLVLTSTTALAVPIQWTVASGGNGHFYEVVQTDNTVSWTQADSAATLAGGYLITITSAAEQAFIETLPKNSGAYWAGGQDLASEGVWRWVTGPEAGTQFWQGTSGGSTTAPFNYANWFGGEPNNSGNEDYLTFNQSSGGAGWNDVGISNSAIRGYIVEVIPEPSTALLLGSGLLGLSARGRRRKT